MKEVAQTMQLYGAMTVEAIKNDLAQFSATGKTAKSIKFKVASKDNVDILFITGRKYIQTIETGRGPRKVDHESGFLDNMEEWVKIKFAGETPEKQKQLAKFFRWKINKEGDKTYKKGGRDVYSHTLIKATDELTKQIKKDFRVNFTNFVKNELVK